MTVWGQSSGSRGLSVSHGTHGMPPIPACALRSCRLVHRVAFAGGPSRCSSSPGISCAANGSSSTQQQRQQPPRFHDALSRAAAALLAAAVSLSSLSMDVIQPPAAQAVLNSPNARIPRTVDAALRRSIPAFNPDVKEVQFKLEDVAFKLRIPQRKPWNLMEKDVEDALKLVKDESKMLYGVPQEQRPGGLQYMSTIQTQLQKTLLAIGAKNADATSVTVSAALQAVGELELLQAPGLPFAVPNQYASLPLLAGRATVQMVVERQDGSLAFYDPDAGGPVKRATIELVVDGYSAPVTAGTFIANISDGMYKNKPLSVNYNTVLVASKNGDVDMTDNANEKLIPLEILPAGEFNPIYRTPLDVQDGELPVLPLSIYGAVSFARPQTDRDGVLSGTDFFIYKFDKQQSGLAGLSFDEGTFGVFGYVTKGIEFVPRLTADDVLVEVRVVTGMERLIRPT